MILPKCNNCDNQKNHIISFNFDTPDLEKIQQGEMIKPNFRIKCECGKCGRYIKFLGFKDNLIDLNNKEVVYDNGSPDNESILDYIKDSQTRVNEKDIKQAEQS